MALDANDAVKDALIVLVNVTEKSGNLRSDLRKDILRAVSNLMKEFAKLRSEVGDKYKLNVGWEMKLEEMESILIALECGVSGNCI
jgi:hypothetical protein